MVSQTGYSYRNIMTDGNFSEIYQNLLSIQGLYSSEKERTPPPPKKKWAALGNKSWSHTYTANFEGTTDHIPESININMM